MSLARLFWVPNVPLRKAFAKGWIIYSKLWLLLASEASQSQLRRKLAVSPVPSAKGSNMAIGSKGALIAKYCSSCSQVRDGPKVTAQAHKVSRMGWAILCLQSVWACLSQLLGASWNALLLDHSNVEVKRQVSRPHLRFDKSSWAYVSHPAFSWPPRSYKSTRSASLTWQDLVIVLWHEERLGNPWDLQKRTRQPTVSDHP